MGRQRAVSVLEEGQPWVQEAAAAEWGTLHAASQRGNTGMGKRTVPMTAIVQTYRQCWARGVVWRLSRVPGSCRAPWGSWAGGGRVGPSPGRYRVAVFHVVTKGGAGMADSESSSCVYSVVYRVNACTRRVCRCMASEAGCELER